MTSIHQTTSLLQDYKALRTAEPRLRARNAAARLNVSEGELVAAACGTSVTRLTTTPAALLKELVHIGQLKVITRNDHAVHEKIGYYDNLQLREGGGGAFDYNINLRLFFAHWAHIFHVVDAGRESLQVFDRDGTSTHKIYLTDDSDQRAWKQLIERFTASDQTPGMVCEPAAQPYEPIAPKNADAAALCRQWREIDDIHQFWFMLRDHRLTRLDALTLATPDLARRVDVTAWQQVLRQSAQMKLAIMAFTRSPGVAQIHTGALHKLVEKDGWFNVLDPSFDLHIRIEAVKQVWVVYRPCDTGGQTSLELYDGDGQMVSHFFGAVNLKAPEMKRWRQLLNDLPSYPAEASKPERRYAQA